MADIIAEQIDAANGGKHAIVFSFLNPSQREKVEALRAITALTLDKFYEIAPEYHQHANEVERLFVGQRAHRPSGKSPRDYAKHVLAAVDGVLEMTNSERLQHMAEQLRSVLFAQGGFAEVYRRDLWRVVEDSELNRFESDFIKKWVLILPYDRNVAQNEGFQMSYSGNLTQKAIKVALNRLPQYQSRAWEIDSQSFYDVSALAETGRLDFAQIARIREPREFEQTVSALEAALYHGQPAEAKRALKEHIKYLNAAIGTQTGATPKAELPGTVKLLLSTSEQLAEHKYGFAKLFPFTKTILARVTDKMALLIETPRQRALRMVGESLVQSAFPQDEESK